MKREDAQKIPHGLYEVTWKKSHGGGTSLAAVGTQQDGRRWICCTNWLSLGTEDGDWERVKSVRQVRPKKKKKRYMSAEAFELLKESLEQILESLKEKDEQISSANKPDEQVIKQSADTCGGNSPADLEGFSRNVDAIAMKVLGDVLEEASQELCRLCGRNRDMHRYLVHKFVRGDQDAV